MSSRSTRRAGGGGGGARGTKRPRTDDVDQPPQQFKRDDDDDGSQTHHQQQQPNNNNNQPRGRPQLLLNTDELRKRTGKKYCDEAELVPLLLAHGLIRRVRTIAVEVRPLSGESFDIKLNAKAPTVGEAKEQIERDEGTKPRSQLLCRVQVSSDGSNVREFDQEPEELKEDGMALGRVAGGSRALIGELGSSTREDEHALVEPQCNRAGAARMCSGSALGSPGLQFKKTPHMISNLVCNHKRSLRLETWLWMKCDYKKRTKSPWAPWAICFVSLFFFGLEHAVACCDRPRPLQRPSHPPSR